MKSDATRVFMVGPSGSVADQVRATQQRLLDVVTKRRQLRAESVEAVLRSDQTGSALARAVAAVVNHLPMTGAVSMRWEEALSLVELDQPSAERLHELQEELKKASILVAFGSHVVSFARDAG